MKKKYIQFDEKAFINRKIETEYFLDYFNRDPKKILFVYGPKSTGKTTLLKKVLKEELDKEKYAVSYFNMRETLVHNTRDFKNMFFPDKLKNFGKTLLTGVNLNLGFFSWNPDEEKMLETNLFGMMMEKIQKANDEGIKPVIILDEFQYLKDIKLYPEIPNDNVLLIEELFKFFIALTKQNNLAHVVCMTSDSYYLEELYHDTKLTNTSDFYHIRHLSYDDIKYWLTEKEDCPDEMFEEIWENLGGSVWEIWQVFVDYKNGQDWRYRIQDLIQNKFGIIMDYVFYEMKEEDKNHFIEITKALAEKGEFVNTPASVAPFHLVKKFVDRDIWFYDAKFGKITPNSKSQQMAMKKLIAEMEKAA
jgi:AAA+ ATPase superfamily predicted ATPase